VASGDSCVAWREGQHDDLVLAGAHSAKFGNPEIKGGVFNTVAAGMLPVPIGLYVSQRPQTMPTSIEHAAYTRCRFRYQMNENRRFESP
jgi:hypothetical protein